MPSNQRSHILHPAHQLDSRLICQLLSQVRRGIPPHHAELDIRYHLTNARQNLLDKKQDGIFIWQPIHGTDKNQAVRFWLSISRHQALRIDTGRYGEHTCRTVLCLHVLTISIGHRNYTIKRPTHQLFITMHLNILQPPK